ncbi:hypothetical protein C672_2003 [[Clostridium] bifermentans ATCC 638]|uniref:Uncharacterized protein n=1 Tax=Paraclostridium bifermentans ATCC 638 = DSM 14991 TaxID=1233171 RepID=T4VH68_PARBF|nr:hypothetical protein [Paraclostridium bifermentans]EQK43059.1 hypothetical protein C672_2003 [[Clostridium] bifermentans ATCC 638] [Paraclostridium bifermentans ATCC 638 = DSM 14991]UAG16933.1 hypothetical protein KXZ80_09040 [Paraclostridium bifermentans]
MKEILVGFIEIELLNICSENEKLASLDFYGTKVTMIVTATYLLGPVILGAI